VTRGSFTIERSIVPTSLASSAALGIALAAVIFALIFSHPHHSASLGES